MEQLTPNMLLDYLYNNFAITYFLCFIGSISGQLYIHIKYNNKKKKLKTIKIVPMIISDAIISLIMSALIDKVSKFNMYALICVLVGFFGDSIVDYLIDKILSRTTDDKYIDTLIDKYSDKLSKEESTKGKIVKTIKETNKDYNSSRKKRKSKTKEDSTEFKLDLDDTNDNSFKLDE